MFKKQMTELAERRHLLVMEADLHRSLIGLERENLRSRLADLQAAREQAGNISPLLIAGGAVAGLLAMRHWRKLARWIPAALTVLRWVRTSKWAE
jgi:hypothetical protein